MTLWHFFFSIEEDANVLQFGLDFSPEKQAHLMKMFFEDICEESKHSLRDIDDEDDFCNWLGINCIEKVIVRIDLAHCTVGNFNLNAVPHTVRAVRLFACQQNFLLETRCFSRDLRGISVRRNQIYGRLDLTNLPPLLELANFSENILTGPIDLTRLPKGLQKMDLSFNSIQQHTVFYGDIPENIVLIRFHAPEERRTIRKICAMNPEKKVRNKSIFGGIKSKNIH